MTASSSKSATQRNPIALASREAEPSGGEGGWLGTILVVTLVFLALWFARELGERHGFREGMKAGVELVAAVRPHA